MSPAEPDPRSGFSVEPTGDPAADAILSRLQGVDGLSPDDEAEAYRAALEALAGLLDEQPRPPGTS